MVEEDTHAKAQRAQRKTYLAGLVAAAITAYFLYFAIEALRARFAPDDMMNLGKYWGRGALGCLVDNFLFWNNQDRPMGALFYLPLYRAFGLNPLPYRVAVLSILAANTYLTYRVADLVAKSKAAAALAAVLVCANFNMVALFYSNALIYDVLAYLFTLLMLFVYIRIRSQGLTPSAIQSALVVCTYIAALDSKEIAVVGAGWVLAYEILFGRPRVLRVPVILMLVGLIYTAAKMYGPDSLSKVEGYTMQFTLHRFVLNNNEYLNQLLYTAWFHVGRRLFIGWAILTFVCWIVRKPEPRWCWFLVSTATLPVSFAEVSRGGPSLYLPLFAWALLAAVFIAVVVQRPVLQWAVVAVLACASARITIHYWPERVDGVLPTQELTWSVVSQLRDLGTQPAHHAKVIFLNNPFNDFDALFIAQLVWNDPTVEIKLANYMPSMPTADELQSFDWIMAFDGQKLRVVRSR